MFVLGADFDAAGSKVCTLMLALAPVPLHFRYDRSGNLDVEQVEMFGDAQKWFYSFPCYYGLSANEPAKVADVGWG